MFRHLLTAFPRFFFVLLLHANLFGQDVPVDFSVITNQPVTDIFRDDRGLIYALPQAEPEIILRYDGNSVVRLGRKEDNAWGLDVPPGYEHSLLFKATENKLISVSNPTEQVAIIELENLNVTLFPFRQLGLAGMVRSIGPAGSPDRWLSLSENGEGLTVYEWGAQGTERSFSFRTNRILEDAKHAAVGDSVLLDVYPGGTFLFDWSGTKVKTFLRSDFEGARQNGGPTTYSYLAELRYQPDGELYANVRWYYPSLYTYDRDDMLFRPADHPFPNGADEFVSIPVADTLGNALYAGGGFYYQRPFALKRRDGTWRALDESLRDAVLGNRNHNDNRTFISEDVSKTIFAASEKKGIVRVNFPRERIRSFYQIFGFRNPVGFGRDSLIISSFDHGVYRMGFGPGEKFQRHVWYKNRKGVIRGSKGSHWGEDGRLWSNDRNMIFGLNFGDRDATEIPLPAEIDEGWALLPGGRAFLPLVDGRLFQADLSAGTIAELPREHFPPFERILSVQVRGDRLWLGTDAGLYRGRPGEADSWELLPPGGPDNPLVYDFYTEDPARWWLATNQGWWAYDPESHELIKGYTVADGLAGNDVRSSVFAKGFYWVGTRSGLSRFDPGTETFRNFSFEEGFTSRKFTRGAVYVPGANYLGFGTDNGYNFFRPEDLMDDPAPTLSLSAVQYFCQEKGREVRNVGAAHLAGKLYLPAAHRSLEVEFFLDDLYDPREHRFAYRMNGADGPWIDLKNQSRLTFTSIDPGSYELELRGRTRFSVWSEPYVLNLTVARFFYNTWWFRLCLAASVIGLIGSWMHRLRAQRTALEEKVRQRTKKIQEDKETIEQQTEELKELDKAKTRFFANISHELRTPLTVIKGFARESRTGEKLAELLARMRMIEKNSDRLLLLVNQLLEIGKLEAGKLTTDYRKVDVRPEIDLVLASVHAVVEEKSLRLRSSISFAELIMDVDVDKLLKILYNLLSNAVKFTSGGGTIGLMAGQQAEEFLRIDVTDTGIGIPEDKLETIFQRFSQVDDGTTRKQEGSGIGLNFARELAELMNGTLSVASSPGEGSTFTLLLPLRQQGSTTEITGEDFLMTGHPDTPDIDAADLAVANQETSEEQPLLLLVEDNPDIIAYLKICLQEKYRIMAGRNGRESLKIAREHIPDLVITDVMMPVMDGLEMCRNLKSDDRTSHIPVIMLTALGSVKNRVKGLREGADAYLSKPFSREELEVQVENLLRSRIRLQAHFKLSPPGVRKNDNVGSPEVTDYTEKEQHFISRVTEVVETRLSDPGLRTDDLARELGLSKSQLWRKIKAVTGYSTGELVESVRMKKAGELVTAGDLSVAEIGYAVGYSDPSYFTKRFSKWFGVVPSAYTA